MDSGSTSTSDGTFARSLEALGFFEVDYASQRVHLCPPTMVLLPDTGTPCALLTGARVPETLTKLRKVVGQAGKQACLLQQAQGRGNINMPHRIVVEAIDKDTLAGIGKEASIDHDLDEPAAWKLATSQRPSATYRAASPLVPGKSQTGHGGSSARAA